MNQEIEVAELRGRTPSQGPEEVESSRIGSCRVVSKSSDGRSRTTSRSNNASECKQAIFQEGGCVEGKVEVGRGYVPSLSSCKSWAQCR